MPATYDPTLSTAKDRMRHALGDTDISNPLRQDETYTALLAQNTETVATATLARALAAEYAQQPVTFSVNGGISVSWPDRVRTWLALADKLDAQANANSNGFKSAQAVRADSYVKSEYVRPIWWSP